MYYITLHVKFTNLLCHYFYAKSSSGRKPTFHAWFYWNVSVWHNLFSTNTQCWCVETVLWRLSSVNWPVAVIARQLLRHVSCAGTSRHSVTGARQIQISSRKNIRNAKMLSLYRQNCSNYTTTTGIYLTDCKPRVVITPFEGGGVLFGTEYCHPVRLFVFLLSPPDKCHGRFISDNYSPIIRSLDAV